MSEDRVACLGNCGRSEPRRAYGGDIVRWLCADCGAKGVSLGDPKDAEIAALRHADVSLRAVRSENAGWIERAEPTPDDYPSAADVGAAADLVRKCAHSLDANGFGLGASVNSANVKLVVEAAWKIKSQRERREDYERATRTGGGA